MQWFYAIDGERRGPVSSEELARLIAHGTVTDDTLVWREGFAAWEPWSRVAEANPLPAIDASVPPPVIEGSADPVATDAERAWSFDEFSRRLEQTGVAISVGGCLSRAWENNKTNLGLMLGTIWVAAIVIVGMCLLLTMLMGILITIVGFLQATEGLVGPALVLIGGFLALIGSFLVVGSLGTLCIPHLVAGCHWLCLVRARGEPAGFSAIFEGFKRCYGKLVAVGLVHFGISSIFFVLQMAGNMTADVTQTVLPIEMLFSVFQVILSSLSIWLSLRLIFSLLVTLDRLVHPLEAFALSWRITRGHSRILLALSLLLGLLGRYSHWWWWDLFGVIDWGSIISLVFLAPIACAVITQYYHYACESAANRSPE